MNLEIVGLPDSSILVTSTNYIIPVPPKTPRSCLDSLAGYEKNQINKQAHRQKLLFSE